MESGVVTHVHARADNDLDLAFKYLGNAERTEENANSINLRALRRKIDWHIIPIMFLCYGMQFLDKVNLNYAAVMGLNADLNFTGNDFSNVSTAFSVAFLIAEVPNGYILQKLPPGKWLGFNVLAWGAVTACTAATTNYQGLLAARIFQGLFEAASTPSLMLIASQWYTKSEQGPRFSFWYCSVGVAQILGGIISFAFQHVAPGVLAGWRIMFIVLGVATIFIGTLAILKLPDTPMSASFLSDAEKIALLNHVSENRTGIQSKHFKLSHVLELLLDVQMWFLSTITILITISSGVVIAYSTTLIKQFGFTSQQAALLNMPSGVISIIWIVGVGYGIRFTSNRWAWLLACCAPAITGGGLMSFASSDNHIALLAGVYLINTIIATIVILLQWTMANVAGHTKRVVASASIGACLSIGNIIGPQTFQAKDAPAYRPAKIIVLATQSSAALLAVVLFGYYSWANKQKQAKLNKLELEGFQENNVEGRWGDLTDKENPEFRYVY